MKGDRVIITNNTGTLVGQGTTKELIMVYQPQVDPTTRFFIQANDKSYLVSAAGGVNKGSTGTIHGDPILVHKTQLHDYEGVIGLGNNDTINLFPIFLDRYQQIGWFPSNVIKVMGGGVGA